MDHGGSEVPEVRELASIAATPRARAKDERRARLIKAARALITEKPSGNFSMGELAARADLSLATPYNLFGSKTAILQGVFRAEMQGLQRRQKSLTRLQPVEQVLATVDDIVSVFAREPDFYRSLTRSMMAITSDDFHASILPISDHMFSPLIDGLIEANAIRLPVPASLLSDQLLRVFNSTFLLWALQNWREDHLLKQLKIGFALSFIGFFEGEDRRIMLSRLSEVIADAATLDRAVIL
jgi:AcrR family transcriptional regulator